MPPGGGGVGGGGGAGGGGGHGGSGGASVSAGSVGGKHKAGKHGKGLSTLHAGFKQYKGKTGQHIRAPHRAKGFVVKTSASKVTGPSHSQDKSLNRKGNRSSGINGVGNSKIPMRDFSYGSMVGTQKAHI